MKKCAIKECINTDNAGRFVGNLCASCYNFIATGIHNDSIASKVRLRIDTDYDKRVENFWQEAKSYLAKPLGFKIELEKDK